MPGAPRGAVGGTGFPLAFRRAEWIAFEELNSRREELGAPRAVVVAGADEGARVRLAAGLATAAAVGGERALVMECDMARPTLASLAGLVAVPGLREYLCWAASARELLQPISLAGVATEGGEPGQLVFITAGRDAANGAALLASESFPAALGKLRRAYDLLVLPTGPLASPELAEVLPEADAMLVCLWPEEESREGIEAAEEALARLPEVATGIVVCERS
jgi:Mrp family chromosome partitioning ATPase